MQSAWTAFRGLAWPWQALGWLVAWPALTAMWLWQLSSSGPRRLLARGAALLVLIIFLPAWWIGPFVGSEMDQDVPEEVLRGEPNPQPVASPSPSPTPTVPSPSPTPTVSSPSPPAESPTPTPSRAPAAPSPTPTAETRPRTAQQPRLPGFGQTRAQWEATHDQVPGREPGSAYLPLLPGGQPTYGGPCCENIIYSYERYFEPGTSVEFVQQAIALQELPRDAEPSRVVEQDTCWILTYTSATIRRIHKESYPGLLAVVAIYKPDAEVPFDRRYMVATIIDDTDPNPTHHLC